MKINECFDVIPKIALQGMRLSRQSKSDTITDDLFCCEPTIGKKDYNLLINLTEKGSEHRKVLRMFQIYIDIEASLKFWKQFDTYKHCVTLSSSTMYNITKKKLTTEDFNNYVEEDDLTEINKLIDSYNKLKNLCEKKKELFEAITDLLPCGYIQRRVLNFNYETALNIIRQRTGHKLKEWRIFTSELQNKLPLLANLIMDGRI